MSAYVQKNKDEAMKLAENLQFPYKDFQIIVQTYDAHKKPVRSTLEKKINAAQEISQYDRKTIQKQYGENKLMPSAIKIKGPNYTEDQKETYEAMILTNLVANKGFCKKENIHIERKRDTVRAPQKAGGNLAGISNNGIYFIYNQKTLMFVAKYVNNYETINTNRDFARIYAKNLKDFKRQGKDVSQMPIIPLDEGFYEQPDGRCFILLHAAQGMTIDEIQKKTESEKRFPKILEKWREIRKNTPEQWDKCCKETQMDFKDFEKIYQSEYSTEEITSMYQLKKRIVSAIDQKNEHENENINWDEIHKTAVNQREFIAQFLPIWSLKKTNFIKDWTFYEHGDFLHHAYNSLYNPKTKRYYIIDTGSIKEEPLWIFQGLIDNVYHAFQSLKDAWETSLEKFHCYQQYFDDYPNIEDFCDKLFQDPKLKDSPVIQEWIDNIQKRQKNYQIPQDLQLPKSLHTFIKKYNK